MKVPPPVSKQLIRLTYYSQVPATLTKRDLRNILSVAQSNNMKRNITGALGFNRDYFVQTLEGERDIISRLIFDIFTDKRHSSPIIAGCHSITEHAFPKWSMMWLGEKSFTEALCQKYCGTPEFSVHRMGDTQMEKFIIDLGQDALNASKKPPEKTEIEIS